MSRLPGRATTVPEVPSYDLQRVVTQVEDLAQRAQLTDETDGQAYASLVSAAEEVKEATAQAESAQSNLGSVVKVLSDSAASIRVKLGEVRQTNLDPARAEAFARDLSNIARDISREVPN